MANTTVPGLAGQTLIYSGFAQTDVDMNHFKLINLDTSNLPPVGGGIPTIHPAANRWLHDWDSATQTWTATQPAFSSLSGVMTGAQQRTITQLGAVTVGQWMASVIDPTYLPTLDLIRSPALFINMASHRITNLGDPVDPQDAVNKRFMDYLLQGLNLKNSVRCASTTDVVLLGLSVPVDGVVLQEGNRVLVKNQSAGREYLNGIWSATASGHWSRSPDSDSADELNRAYCYVREGNVNAGTSWVQTKELTDPLSSTNPPFSFFVLFSTATQGPQGIPGPAGQGVPVGGSTGQFLSKRTFSDYDTQWVTAIPGTYASLQTGQLIPSVGNPSPVIRMMGLAQGGRTITPTFSGKVAVTIAGTCLNNNQAASAAIAMWFGSGTPPAPAAAATGTQLGAGIVGSGLGTQAPFSISGVVTDLLVGQPVWFDLSLGTIHGGEATLSGVSITAYEIP